MSDVAVLAQVRRPVVTMWRRRYAAGDRPFPAPVDLRGRRPFFDADEVVGWLESTGRGNNEAARADLAALVRPGGVDLTESRTFAAVTALLTLVALCGHDLPETPDALVDLADEWDPDDSFLFREIDAVGVDLVACARFVADLTAASYSAAAAFEGLLADRFRLNADAADALAAPELFELLAGLWSALAAESGFGRTVLVDPAPVAADLLVQVLSRVDEAEAEHVSTPLPSDATGRLGQRRLRVRGLAPRPLRMHDGRCELPAEAVVVTRLAGSGWAQLLTRVGDIAVELTGRQRAVVVTPAAVVSQRLTGPDRAALDDLLRGQAVRAVVRLPQGLLDLPDPGAPRPVVPRAGAGSGRPVRDLRPGG